MISNLDMAQIAALEKPGCLLQLDCEAALRREQAMLATAASPSDNQPPALTWFLWQTQNCIVVPRSHLHYEGFEAAMAASEARGWPVYLRDTGGGAVVQGQGVINLAMTFHVAAGHVAAGHVAPGHVLPGVSQPIADSYRILCAPVMAMLQRRGIKGAWRAIPGTMCDGAYNIVVDGRKLAGTAQRWRSLGRKRPGEHAVFAHLALFAALDHETAASALNALYGDIGRAAGIRAASHINWAEIETNTGPEPVAALAQELDAACAANIDKPQPL